MPIVAAALVLALWLAGDHVSFRAAHNRQTLPPRWEFGSNPRWISWSGFGDGFRLNDLTLLRQYPDAEGVDLSFSSIGQGDYSELTKLPHLMALMVSNDVTDRDCLQIARCTSLEQLSLQYTAITDEGLANIAVLDCLKTLHLPSATTDVAMRRLARARLPLQSLWLEGSQVGNAGAQYLAAFPNLTYLNVSATQVTGDGLRSLRTLNQLTTLHADNLELSDEFCDTLRQLPELRKVSILNSNITDRGVAILAGHPQLELLYLGGTQVTDQGLEWLARSRSIIRVGYSERMSPEAIKKFELRNPRPPHL